MADDTRDRLLDAAAQTLAEVGIAATSARTIGARAGVNPALIYYHFDSLAGLLAEASRTIAAERARVYRERLAEVDSLTELAAVARQLHEQEHRSGNLAVLSQLLAGSRTHPELAPALEDNFRLLAHEVAEALQRLIDGTALDGLIDTRQLARAVSAGFIGIELLDTVSGHDDNDLFDALDRITALLDLALHAGALPAALIRRQLRRTTQQPPLPDG